jgi:hypothetical protein
MVEPEPCGPILRRTFGPETTGLRVLTPAEDRRRVRRRSRSRLAIASDLDRRLHALGYRSASYRRDDVDAFRNEAPIITCRGNT